MGTMNAMKSGHRSTLSNLFGWLGDHAARRRSRQSLLDLDDAMLRDIGVTRAQAQREANRPFWS